MFSVQGGGGCNSCLGNVCLTVTVETVWGLKHFNKQLSCVNKVRTTFRINKQLSSVYISIVTDLYLSRPTFNCLLPWLNHYAVQQRAISCEYEYNSHNA